MICQFNVIFHTRCTAASLLLLAIFSLRLREDREWSDDLALSGTLALTHNIYEYMREFHQGIYLFATVLFKRKEDKAKNDTSFTSAVMYGR